MNLEQCLKHLQDTYEIVGQVDLDQLPKMPVYERASWINKCLINLWQDQFKDNQRILVTATSSQSIKIINDLLHELQRQINAVDISNFFITLVTPERESIKKVVDWVSTRISTDPVPMHLVMYKSEQDTAEDLYDYNSSAPLKINLEDLQDNEKYLLTESKTFCIYPWIHMHAYPTGDAYPCCMANMNSRIGNTREKSLKDIWNDQGMRQLRVNMLTDQPSSACHNCYEKEQAGFFSGRMSANKHHGHHIDKVKHTDEVGTLDQFEMIYWDIRFSNLCNLSCRSCGHIFSSSWYQDQAQLAGGDWKKQNRVLNYAGRTETDIWEQLIPHLDYVEQIYFAGGEPLLMEEHYNILEELERRGRFDVRLVYNTNFTHIKLKDRTVFDYWKKFQSVSVGASLDDMGTRAEYIRKGTVWNQIETNRRQMLEICPEVDFYISPTLSILNAHSICDFHRYMVEQGLIRPQDVNVNILQDPAHLRIDIATPAYKQILKEKFEQHLEWLRPQDKLGRASVGFESSIKFMMGIDNTDYLPKFWQRTQHLDEIRGEDVLLVIPELVMLK